MKHIKQTTKLKLNALLTLFTSIVLGNAETGIVRLICWIGLVIEFVIFAMIFEKELDNDIKNR